MNKKNLRINQSPITNSFRELKIPGRICLMGDKIDLLGKPVIAAAIDTIMTIKIRKIPEKKIKLYSETFKTGLEYNLGEKGDWNHLLKYWCCIAYRLRDRIGGFEAIINSDIPVGKGVSSSAAISVAITKALNEEFKLTMSDTEIAELAYQAEHTDLGIMCGRMDQYAIAFGGVTFIETGEVPRVERLPIESLPVVVGDSQEERQSKVVLNRVKEHLNNNDKIYHDAFNVIYKCVLESKEALLNKDFKKLGECMNEQQRQENIIEAATPKLNALCAASIKAGAFGAKQMGAGGGGCMVAVCPGKQKEVAEAIELAGGRAWIFNIFNYPSTNQI